MTIKLLHRVPARAGAVALGLALGHGMLSAAYADDQTAGQAAPPATGEEAAARAPGQPGVDRIHAAHSAMEARHAEHMVRMQARQDEMREKAAAQGIDIPAPPPLPEAPRWMSYEEMRDEMKRRGVEMRPMPTVAGFPASSEPPSAPAMADPMAPPAVMGTMSTEEHKRLFDVVEAMTPEQQEACFTLSRWHALALVRPPMQGRSMGPPPGHGTGYAPGYPAAPASQGYGPAPGPRGYGPAPGGQGFGPMMFPNR